MSGHSPYPKEEAISIFSLEDHPTIEGAKGVPCTPFEDLSQGGVAASQPIVDTTTKKIVQYFYAAQTFSKIAGYPGEEDKPLYTARFFHIFRSNFTPEPRWETMSVENQTGFSESGNNFSPYMPANYPYFFGWQTFSGSGLSYTLRPISGEVGSVLYQSALDPSIPEQYEWCYCPDEGNFGGGMIQSATDYTYTGGGDEWENASLRCSEERHLALYELYFSSIPGYGVLPPNVLWAALFMLLGSPSSSPKRKQGL